MSERPFARLPLAVGAAGLVLCLVLGLFDRAQFFHAYLVGFLYWLGISLGSLAILMLYHLVGGKWGFFLRRLLEAGSRTLPLMALFFVPLLFGLRELFPWARPEAVAADPILQAKRPYLNPAFFTVRAAFFFGVWILLAFLLSRWSAREDATADPSLALRLQRLSAAGLLIYAFTTLFASVDWAMSLEPHFYSAIFGMTFIVGHGVSTMAFVILVASAYRDRPTLSGVAGPGVFHDLGNLLFMFLMLWAYMAFSQLIIIWSANLPEDILWYLPRLKTSWELVSLALLLFYFGAPFLILLSRSIKRDLKRLSAVAAAVLVMRLVDVIWVIEPSFHHSGVSLHWMDLLAPAGIGGIWIAVYRRELESRPLLALHDPRAEGAAEHV
jgi:hypothetical protein